MLAICLIIFNCFKSGFVMFDLNMRFCEKNCIGTSVQASISSFSENLVFYKSSFWLFFTFDWYFVAWEHENRMQHEKISPGSYPEIFWPDGKLIGAKLGKR